MLSRLPRDELLLLKPQSNLLLGVLDAVGAVAYIAANGQGIVAANGARSGSQRVGGAKDGWIVVMLAWWRGEKEGKGGATKVGPTAASLDGISTLPNHGGNRAAVHVCGNVSRKPSGGR